MTLFRLAFRRVCPRDVSRPSRRRARRGSSLLIVLLLTAALGAQVVSLSMTLTHGTHTDSAEWTRQRLLAQTRADAALNRLTQRLRIFLTRRSSGQALVAFSQDGAFQERLLPAMAAASGERPEASVRAWLLSRRGAEYHLVCESRSGGVRLTFHRRVWLPSPQLTSF